HTIYETWGEFAEEALEPDAKLIAHQGEWWLFESTHLKHGILAPDGVFPAKRPHTLRKRMKDVSRRHNGEPIPPDPLAPPEQDPPPPKPEATDAPGEEPSTSSAPLAAPPPAP